MSEPRKTRLETRDRYSSFFRKSESKSAIRVATDKHRNHRSIRGQIGSTSLGLPRVVEDQSFHLRLRAEVEQQADLDRCGPKIIQQLRFVRRLQGPSRL